MFVRLDTLTKAAAGAGYGIPAPTVYNSSSVGWCFAACQQMRAPLILSCNEKVGDYLEMADFAKYFERRYPEVPVALALDHGTGMETAIDAIRAGYTSVMVDRGEEPPEENARYLKEVCRMAHAMNVSVEGALGGCERNATPEEIEATKTKVDEAIWYCRQTGVDALAVAVGAAHGDYPYGAPVIDFALIAELKRSIPATLVMHGASFTGHEALARSAKAGITKFNVFGELSTGAMERAKKVYAMDGDDRRRLFLLDDEIEIGYRESLCGLIQLFGCKNRW